MHIRNKRINRSIAERLATVKDAQMQEKLANEAAKKQWTVKTLNINLMDKPMLNQNDTSQSPSECMTLFKCNVPNLLEQIKQERKSKQETQECDQCADKKLCERIAMLDVDQNEVETQKTLESKSITTEIEPNDAKMIEPDNDSQQPTDLVFEDAFESLTGKRETEDTKALDAPSPESAQSSTPTNTNSDNKPTDTTDTPSESAHSSTPSNTAIVLQKDAPMPHAAVVNENTLQPQSSRISLDKVMNQVEPEKAIVQQKTSAESTLDSASAQSSAESTELTITKKTDSSYPIEEINVKKTNTSPEEVLSKYPETLDEMALSEKNSDIFNSKLKDRQSLLLAGEPISEITSAWKCFVKQSYGEDSDLFCLRFTADELNRNEYRNSKSKYHKSRDILKTFCIGWAGQNNPIGFKTVVIEDADKLDDDVVDSVVAPLTYETDVRFILAASKLDKVHPKLSEGATRMSFVKPEIDQIVQVLKTQAQKAGLEISDVELKQIAESCDRIPSVAVINLRDKYMISKSKSQAAKR